MILLAAVGCSDDGFDPGTDGMGGFDGSTYPDGYVGPKRPVCPGQDATITGTVTAPNGKDPVPGATVFVPSQVPELFPPEVKCELCSSLGTAYNFWTTTTKYDGSFSLTGVCPGKRNVVLQNGRFRRFLSLDVPASGTLQLTAEQARLPRKHAENHPIDAVPKIAVATGDYDKMECVLRKMGLDDSAFDLYEGAFTLKSPTALPAFSSLVTDLEKMKGYNVIFINCTNNAHEEQLKSQKVRQNIDAYLKEGGRLYITDWSYDWLEQVETLSKYIDFEPGQSNEAPEPQNAATLGLGGLEIDATIKDPQLAQWLGLFPGAISGGKSRIEHFLAEWVMIFGLNKETKLWVEGPVKPITGAESVKPLTLTFNFENCGKALFSSYHTEGREGESSIFPLAYPDYCGTDFSPQDRILEYLIFDIANCIKPIE